MSRKSKSVADDLRRAIAKAERRGMNRLTIAKSAGISYSVMVRIADGQNLPRLDTAEKIVKAIGGRLTIYPK